jgi:hypothetical protein
LVINVTLPVGRVVAGGIGLTIAVNVTPSPVVEGFKDETTALLELAGVTVNVPFTNASP